MKFYVVTVISSFVDNPIIESFHYGMFHGLAERDGEEFPHDELVWANTESPSQLLISRTARDVPEISMPGRTLVVSERLAKQLHRFPHIRIVPVNFKRLVDVEYKKGDMSFWEKWGHGDAGRLLRTLPDVPEFHRTIGQYFEIHNLRWRDIVENYPAAKEITIEEGMPYWQESATIRLSIELLSDYPIFSVGNEILSEAAMDVLGEAFDRDFFLIREYDVPE